MAWKDHFNTVISSRGLERAKGFEPSTPTCIECSQGATAAR